MQVPVEFYDEAALVERLTTGVERSNQSVIFLVGSALTAPYPGTTTGVPAVSGVIDLIRNEFTTEQQLHLDAEMSKSGNRYQAAFSFLLGRRGQQAVNQVIKQAVWRARTPEAVKLAQSFSLGSSTPDDACRALDTDLDGWHLSPAVEALGGLVARHRENFGHTILTTNFDPLIGVAVTKSEGHFFRTILHRDGNLGQTAGTGCHIIHLHGYWYGADTLHTPRQLSQERPRLKASLSTLVKSKTIVVSAYGGWDDVFTEALMEVVLDDNAFPEIIWTFNSPSPSHDVPLMQKLAPGIDRGRVTLYAGIDCHSLFPKLLQAWDALNPRLTEISVATPRETKPQPDDLTSIDDHSLETVEILEGRNADRPPQSEVYVGREDELALLLQSSQTTCFITGMGGEGKSTLAAKYFAEAQTRSLFDVFVWRDCKEESERFENQLIDMIVKLSKGRVTAQELAHQSMKTLAQLLTDQTDERRLLCVFDNVDHYVHLENFVLTGNVQTFLTEFLQLPSNIKLLFTCRPQISYPDANVLTVTVPGLSLESAVELFRKRGATATSEQIQEAHSRSNGHAFWLDLIAAQAATQRGDVHLKEILENVGPANTTRNKSSGNLLFSIWSTLHDKQRIVLQMMAETVKAESLETIGDYLSSKINYNQVSKAVRALRALNLIVVKPQRGSEDLLELHPLIRDFIRRTFPLTVRISFIDAIIRVYARLMGNHKNSEHKPFYILEHWTENAALFIEAGKLPEAFACLAEIDDEFSASAAPGEFARIVRLLLSKIDWAQYSSFPKFDEVFSTYFTIILNLGREEEYRSAITEYSKTVQIKDARYINYCRLKCAMHWTRGEPEAVEWGAIGKELKDSTEVDTRWSTDHYLALAQRDFGQPDVALVQFLQGAPIEKIVDPDEMDEDRGAELYGNVGRSLHLMGQIDTALICYRKSAQLLQRISNRHFENQGYIRSWIGELMIAKNDVCSAYHFINAAKNKWKYVAPYRIKGLDNLLSSISEQSMKCPQLNEQETERFVVRWIM